MKLEDITDREGREECLWCSLGMLALPEWREEYFEVETTTTEFMVGNE